MKTLFLFISANIDSKVSLFSNKNGCEESQAVTVAWMQFSYSRLQVNSGRGNTKSHVIEILNIRRCF